ncbi:MAG TPA: glycosyltransferase family 2 protein [Stellaceae bacterium]|nr:glycosyltransferase family 2 protein [Stellaceae bacterium]
MPSSGTAVSVIIPAFNRRHEISRAIQSALGQTRAPDEVIVIDDASTDGTADVVSALGESRVRVLRRPRNWGAAAARNVGIEAAQSDWIAFLDSDDEWDPRKLELQLAALAGAPADMPAGITGYRIEDYRHGEASEFRPSARDASLDALVWGCPLSIGSTLLARRTVFTEVGLLDPELRRLEDWEWLMRYLPARRLNVIPDPLAIVHKASDPSFAQVETAVARIRVQHRAEWYRRSWLAGRKFDSTLMVEEAAAAYWAQDKRRAALLSLQALMAYPFRRGNFLTLLARRAFSGKR